jgi:L-ascorbate metabolism protein UlaG (beta-lactamase superfamily)
MTEPINTGATLAAEIENARPMAPTLWWLGHSGFAVKFLNILFLVDPCLAEVQGRVRVMAPPLAPDSLNEIDLILCTHPHDPHMHGPTLARMLAASRRARVVLPKSATAHAASLGIEFDRMTTTDSDLRVEYFKDGLYSRVYAVPSAHDLLEWTASGGFPYLGYLMRFGGHTIYHAGDCVLYDGLAERLKPYNVTVALLPIAGRNFSVQDAAQLAEDIGARWLVPMHYGMFADDTGDVNRFIEHMLGHRPQQRFKIFECGEKWTLPED